MSRVVPLAGGTVTLRDPEAVSERLRRPVLRLQMQLAASPLGELLAMQGQMDAAAFEAESRRMLGSDGMALLEQLNDALIVALVESWSWPAPVTADGLLDLPAAAYDAVKAETSKYVTKLMPDFGPTPAEESPTPPSAG